MAAPLLPILLLPVGMLLCFAVHEGGHVIAGSLVGQRLVAFVAGPLAVLRIDGRLRFGLNSRLALYGGLALCVGPTWHGARRYLRARAIMLAGGPALSILAGAVMVTFSLWMSRGNARALVTHPLAFAAFYTGIMSLAIAVTTLAPGLLRPEGPSDGARIRQAVRALRDMRIQRADALLAPFDALTIISGQVHLQRARDWHEYLVDQLSEQMARSPSVQGLLLLRLRALDTGYLQRANDYLDAAERLAERSDPSLVSLVVLERALQYVLWEEDVETAREALSAAGIEQDESTQTLLLRAAIAHASGFPLVLHELHRELLEAAWEQFSPGVVHCQAPALDRLARMG